MQILPHRYPFPDGGRRVEDGRQQNHGLQEHHHNEPYFPGHFPGHPIMPGVLQLEAIAQVAGILMLRQAENVGQLAYFMAAEDVKWRKPVLPGDVLVIEVELTKSRGKIGKAKGVCKVDGEIVSEAEVTFMLRALQNSMIHPTAIVHPKAIIGPGCRIGPYCVIGEHVALGENCELHSHVVIDGHTTLGQENEIFPFASLGLRTQDLKWKGGVTRLEIGDRNTIREYVTIHSATGDGEATVIGSDNNILAGSHIGAQRRDGQSRDHLHGGAGRPCDRGRLRARRRPFGGASILPHRQDGDDRRLLEGGARRAAVHDRRRQSDGNAHHQQGRPGTQWRLRSRAIGVAPGLQDFISRRPDHSQRAGEN
jgi:beta-hydroxyacyl-ACP dehydratase FabZ